MKQLNLIALFNNENFVLFDVKSLKSSFDSLHLHICDVYPTVFGNVDVSWIFT